MIGSRKTILMWVSALTAFAIGLASAFYLATRKDTPATVRAQGQASATAPATAPAAPSSPQSARPALSTPVGTTPLEVLAPEKHYRAQPGLTPRNPAEGVQGSQPAATPEPAAAETDTAKPAAQQEQQGHSGQLGVAIPSRPKPARPAPRTLAVAVLPHPDDEMQVVSLLQSSSNSYPVLLFLTRGEKTGACLTTQPFNPRWQERSPAPSPYSSAENCAKARIASTVGFLNTFARTTSRVPGGFTTNRTVTLPTEGAMVNPTATVFRNSLGAAVFFNLGDGNLTPAEVSWAIRATLNNRTTLGLPQDPLGTLVGAYANDRFSQCARYPHADHLAIHQALQASSFNAASFQGAAVCGADPRARLRATIPSSVFLGAFSVNQQTRQRIGSFQRWYGWLNGDTAGWAYDASATGQRQLFARHQTFARYF